jgi:hypothetical protein
MKALLVGINYVGTANELSGCVNDVVHLMQFIKHGGLTEEDIEFYILTDAGYNGDRTPIEGTRAPPTRANILKGLDWLIEGARDGDKLLFHYSGHGSQVPDHDGDEEDGMDEALVPLDYRSAGYILDDLLRSKFERLPAGVIAHVFCDSCHSGTMLDLRYEYPDASKGDAKAAVRINKRKSETHAQIIALSGCQDYQVHTTI